MKRDFRGLLLIVFAILPVGIVQAQDPFARLDMENLPAEKVVSGKLSESQRLDGQACRVIQSGQPVLFALDPWWGDGVQPPEDTMYVAAVRYKDTLEQPAIFLSYAGLSTGEGPSEMHRFGGLHDGQWKTACVPLSWDMVLRDFDSGKVKLGIRSTGELPIASIQIVPIDPDAESRFNTETREWVRRAQADLKPAPATQSRPAIPNLPADQAIVPYTRPYVRVVLPLDVPQQAEIDAPIRVRMTCNEYEPAAFAVYAARQNLTNVTYEISSLAGPGGPLAVDIHCGTLEYTLKAQTNKPAQVVPQRIWPMYPVDIEQGRSHWFWATLKTDPTRSKPGKYTGTVTIKADQGHATLPIEVEVLPFNLVSLDRAALHYGGCHPALLPVHEMRDLLEHNLNIMNIWAGAVGPRISIKNGKMTLDFRFMDYWMKQARQSGIQAFVWFLGGDPYGYPRTMAIERELYIALHDGEKPFKDLYDDFIKAAATPEHRGRTLPEVEPFYRQWVREVWRHAKVNDWPELIMTPFDEPAMWVQGPYRKQGGPYMIGTGPWIRDHFEFACKLLHDEAPGIRVYASIHGNTIPGPDWTAPADDDYPRVREGQVFIDDIDVMCTNAIDDDPHLGDMTRAMGKDFWQYSGGDSTRPDRVRYTFGFFFGAYNSRGGLFWAYDWGSGFDTSRGSNYYLAWRTPFGVISSPAYECMREALDDRRYIETLKRMAADHQTDVRDFVDQLAQAAVGQRTAAGRDTVNDFFAEARDMQATDFMRQRVIEKILDVSTKGWPTSRPAKHPGPASQPDQPPRQPTAQ